MDVEIGGSVFKVLVEMEVGSAEWHTFDFNGSDPIEALGMACVHFLGWELEDLEDSYPDEMGFRELGDGWFYWPGSGRGETVLMVEIKEAT